LAGNGIIFVKSSRRLSLVSVSEPLSRRG